MLQKAYSQMRDEEGQGQEEKEQCNPPARADSSEFEFVNPQHSLQVSPLSPQPPVTKTIAVENPSKLKRPGIMSRRHSGSDVQTPRPTNFRPESKLGFKTLPLLKPPKSPPERTSVELTLTPPLVLAVCDIKFTLRQVPSVALTDGRLLSALADLPLASEDMYLDGVAFGSGSSGRDDQSMRELFLLLGYQNILFVWTALMLEEVSSAMSTHSHCAAL